MKVRTFLSTIVILVGGLTLHAQETPVPPTSLDLPAGPVYQPPVGPVSDDDVASIPPATATEPAPMPPTADHESAAPLQQLIHDKTLEARKQPQPLQTRAPVVTPQDIEGPEDYRNQYGDQEAPAPAEGVLSDETLGQTTPRLVGEVPSVVVETEAPRVEPMQPVAPRRVVIEPTVKSLPVARKKTSNGSTVYSSPNVAVAVPVLAIETTGPSDINVNKTATFTISLKNMGDTIAHDIKLRTVLPRGVELAAASLRGVNDNGVLSFEVGDLQAKKTTQVRIDVTPRQRGTVELISSATITSRLTSKLNIRQPQLKLATQTAKEAIYGKTVPLRIIISNVGDGVAENVVITPQLPGSLTNQNPAQSISVGTLQPGQSKAVPYSVPATQTGRIDIGFKAAEAGGEYITAKTHIVVRRPMLETEFVGPNVTFLDRENVYELRVSNPGDADVKDVEVFCALARGLQVTVLGSKAGFNREKNLLQTKIALLPAGATEILRFKAKAVIGGQQLQEALARTKGGLTSTQQHITKVMTRANLSVAIGSRQGATEVDESATVDIAVVNGGSALAENVEVRVVLPAALKGVIGEAYDIQNNEVRFSAATIEPKKRMILSFKATSRLPGDHRFKVIVIPSDGSSPLTLEGGAFFFDSRQLNDEVANQPGTDGQSTRR
jgi:uncharacterized repeat protein (TIGR01451 family)